jgi:glycosyltransferase involved in cell wall biosynthesis
LYLGRLGPEKGVRSLVEAWLKWGDGAPPLELIGDGPERSALEALVAGRGGKPRIAFTGPMAFADAQARLARARLLVLPSVCIEGFPMVIREAYAAGVPVAASRLGPLPELVRDGVTGVLFEAGNPEDLRTRVAPAWSDQPRLSEMAQAARREFDARYTAEIGYRRLMEIYEEAIGARRERGKANGS